MAWPVDVADGQVLLAAHVNAIRNSVASWGGNVNANSNSLISVNTLGVGTASPGAGLHVAKDSFGGEGGGQVWLTAGTDPTKRMLMGYNVGNNTTFIDSVIAGVTAVNLVLNPSHGMVYLSAMNLGVTGLPNQFCTFIINEGANTLTVYARYSTGVLKSGNIALV